MFLLSLAHFLCFLSMSPAEEGPRGERGGVGGEQLKEERPVGGRAVIPTTLDTAQEVRHARARTLSLTARQDMYYLVALYALVCVYVLQTTWASWLGRVVLRREEGYQVCFFVLPSRDWLTKLD